MVWRVRFKAVVALFILACLPFLLMGCVSQKQPALPLCGNPFVVPCQAVAVSGIPAPFDPATGKPMKRPASPQK